MKKKVFLTISAILVLVCGYFFIDHTYVRYGTIAADREELANDVVELGNVSDIIVKATIFPDKENKLTVLDDGTVLFGYTLTKIQVNEVFKGEVNVGDVLEITEEYYTNSDGVGKTIFTQGDYEPAKEGEKYILFLKKYDDTSSYQGMYFPVDLEKGKYIVDENINEKSIDNLSNKELEIHASDNNRVKEYKEWFKEIIKKY